MRSATRGRDALDFIRPGAVPANANSGQLPQRTRFGKMDMPASRGAQQTIALPSGKAGKPATELRMAATKQEAAIRAAKKFLGHFSPTQGVAFDTVRQAAEKQATALRRRKDTAYTVSLNEAAGVLALEPDRLRRLVAKHPFGPPPLFTRAASKPRALSAPAGATAPARKPNSVERASLVRLFDWHDALVAEGAIEPIGERIHPDARIGGTDNAFVARDRSLLTVRAPFVYSRDKRGTFRITGVTDPDDLVGLLRSLGGREVQALFLTFPEALQLPWRAPRTREAVASVYVDHLRTEEATLRAHLADLVAVRLAVMLPPPDADRSPPMRKPRL